MNVALVVALVVSCLLSGAALVALLGMRSFTNMTQLSKKAIGSVNLPSRATAKPRREFAAVKKVVAYYDEAGITPPSQVIVLIALAAVVIFATIVAAVAKLNLFVALVLALVGVAGLFYLDYSRRKAKRIESFGLELPSFLLTLSSSLRAGLSLDQSISELTKDSPTVLGQQFSAAKREVELGKTWHEALVPIAVRMNSQDLRNLIEGLALAQETGSSLTGILEAIAESCLERAQLKREIKTLTAEGMLSAYVIIALPFIIFLFLLLTQPSYAAVLWTPGIGMVMGITTIILIAFGWVWLKRTIMAGSK